MTTRRQRHARPYRRRGINALRPGPLNHSHGNST
ncbi:hypothetical protein P3T36_007866 [Kitasatospora sp. MAP12-15]|nr:hypothetical protein [Kitasatospora sp. MAP12-44]